MAHRLKWLLGVSAAMVVIYALVQSIDIRQLDPGGYSLRRQESQLRSRVAAEEWLLRETVWADTLIPLLPAGSGQHVRVFGQLRDSSAAFLDAALAKEWEAAGQTNARIGVFVISATLGAHTDFDYMRNRNPVYYTGSDERGPYCLAVLPQHEFAGRLDGPVGYRGTPTNLLGPCRWWARYGAPGAHVDTWLRNGGGYWLASHPAPPTKGIVSERRTARFAVGTRTYGLSPFASACIGGRAEYCTETFANALVREERITPFNVTGSPAAFRGRPFWSESHYNGREAFMIAELEREMGSERFARFWGTDEPIEAAFANAFGISLGEWVMQWARVRFPAAVEQSDRAGLTVVLTILTLGLLFGAGIIEAQRRQIR